MMKRQVDTLVINGHLFTMQGDGVGYVADGALAVEGSQLVAVAPTQEIVRQFEGRQVIDASRCAVLPGLINAHVDTTLVLLRGAAQDVPGWLMDAAMPYFVQLTPDACMAATRLRVVEELKAGTTTFCDNRIPDPLWGPFFEAVGARASLAPMFDALPLDMPALAPGELYPFDVTLGRRAMETAAEFVSAWNGAASGRITTMMGVYSPDLVPLELLLETKKIAQREGVRLHVHVAQGARETEQLTRRYGKRPIPFLSEIGYLDEQLLAIHLTDASAEEVAQVARSGAGMALCSGMIGLIDGLVPPARAFREAGGAVALGSSYNNLFGEMKLAALFNKIRHQNPTIMPAWEVLRMATIEGARAIGLEHKIGSLEVGKEADVVLVDLNTPSLSPLLLNPIRNLVPNLVYAASGSEVKSVMVAGKLLVEDRRVLTVDETAIVADAQHHAQLLSQRVAAAPSHKHMTLMDAMAKGQL